MPARSSRGCKARRNREHVETFSSALLWSGSIRMTLYYMPGWIMEALVGEHFNWCMNMQLCLIPGPEINQVDVRRLFLAFTTCTLAFVVVCDVRLYSVLAAVEETEESGPCSPTVYLHLESTTRHRPSVAFANVSLRGWKCSFLHFVAWQGSIQNKDKKHLFFFRKFSDI